MKKILILEDSKERMVQFRKNYINVEMTITDNPPEAIKLLQENKYFALFLDHDLGGETMCPSDEKSGYAVAKFLEDNPKYQPENIFIHSLNAAGQRNMKAALPKAKVIPFAWNMQANFAKLD